MRSIRYLGSGLLTILLWGCADGAPGDTSSEVPLLDSLPTLALVEELRIGSVDDPDYGFSRIRDVRVDDRGRMYVFESLDREIRVYSPDGQLLRRMGGAGEGPGEFRGSLVAFGVSRDTIWAMDWSFGAMGLMSLFDSTGSLLRTQSVEEVSLGADPFGFANVVVAPMENAGSGLLMGDLNPFSGAVQLADDPDSLRVPRVRFTLTGEVVDTAGWYMRQLKFESRYIDVGAGQYRVPSAPRSDPLDIHVADGRFTIERGIPASPERGAFTVTRIRFEGDTVFSRDYAYGPIPYPADYLDQLAGRAARPGRTMLMGSDGSTMIEALPRDSARAHARLLDAMSFPAFQRPVAGEGSFAPHHVGNDGSLWLQSEWTGAEETPWTVLDPTGDPVGRIALAGSFRIVASDAECVWAVVSDDLGVPWLVRYRISVEP